jgi:hypothetical protein
MIASSAKLRLSAVMGSQSLAWRARRDRATTVLFAYDANGHLVKKTDGVTTDSFRPQFKIP